MLIFCCLFCMIISKGKTSTCIYAESGATTILKCPITKNVYKMQWSYMNKSGKIVISDENIINPKLEKKFMVIVNILDELYELSITNLSKSDENTYFCWTQNEPFNTTSTNGYRGITQIVFTLYLKKPPLEVRVVNMTEDNRIVGKENENLTLACYTLGGIPRGKTLWYHGKKKLTMNKDDSEWTYYSITLNRNNNEQIYTCIAEHGMLRTPLEQSIKLDILYHPRVQCLWPKEPVSVGHDVNLSCSYYSNPLDAEILWTKNSQNIDSIYSIVTKIAVGNDRKWTDLEDMTKDDHGVIAIIIKNVTRSDEGAYTCIVTNTEGSASETVYLAVQDNDSETITDSLPPYSGTSFKGFLAKEQIIYHVFIVLLVLVLIIISFVGHVYIWNRCKQTNYTVPQREVVRHSPIEIEMHEAFNNAVEHEDVQEDVHEESRNLPLLSEILQDLQNTTSGDSQSNLSKTNTSQSSFSLSDRSQNINEEDYLHPYHGFVHNRMDVHEYATVDAKESTEYEEITDAFKVEVTKM